MTKSLFNQTRTMKTNPFVKRKILRLAAAAALLTVTTLRAEPDACCQKESGNATNSAAALPTEAGAGQEKKMCPEHNVAAQECGICKPQLAATLKVGESAKIRLAASDSVAIAGIELGKPAVGSIADGIECYAEMAFNQNKLAQIAAPVGGILQEVDTDLGNRVAERQVLAKVWSAAIAEGVAKAVLTHQTLDRERKLRAERVTSEKDLQQAEADHRAACQQARTLGFSEEDIDHMKANPNDPVYLEVRAPFAGDIVERTAVRGALVDAGKPLFTLADRATLWAMLNLPESAVGRVKEGQLVELRFDALPGQTFTGKLTWIAAEVDEKSRMARARAEVQDPNRLLKARMFARARILTRSAEGAVLLPSSAIQRLEGRSFVFVRREPDLFDARVVRLGASYDGWVEVLEGLESRETVALNHVFPLKSAFLISRLGAGCADD
jgi:cobalt-zinc-cadmium efflux system membrane fusion protein